jgi:hypothetical protein
MHKIAKENPEKGFIDVLQMQWEWMKAYRFEFGPTSSPTIVVQSRLVPFLITRTPIVALFLLSPKRTFPF